MIGGIYITTQLCSDRLHAIADTKHRDSQIKDGLCNARRLAICYGLRTAGEDNPLGSELPDKIFRRIKWMNLTVDPTLAHTSGYELGILRAEVNDQQPLIMNIVHDS